MEPFWGDMDIGCNRHCDKIILHPADTKTIGRTLSFYGMVWLDCNAGINAHTSAGKHLAFDYWRCTLYCRCHFLFMEKTALPSHRLAFICVRRQHISFLFGIEKRLINTNQLQRLQGQIPAFTNYENCADLQNSYSLKYFFLYGMNASVRPLKKTDKN